MSDPTRVAIIGCGWAGARHARALEQCGAELRWLVDVEPTRAEVLRGPHGTARITADYCKALQDAEVDAVDICLPHNLHAPVAVAAARAGKHILCEKPLADTLTAADEMIAAAEATHVTLMVAENEHFSPLYRRMRQLVQEGAIGRPALAQLTRECYLNRSFLEDRRWFLSQKAAAGGMMMSGGVHSFDTLRSILGEVESVQALRARQRFTEMEGDDTSVALVRFQGGAVGTLVESFCMKSLATAAGAEVHSLRIDGDLGSLWVLDGQTIRLFSERPEYLPGGALLQHDLHVAKADTFQLEIEHWLQCLRTGAEPETSGRAQRRNLEVVLAAYRSMETGQPVQLS